MVFGFEFSFKLWQTIQTMDEKQPDKFWTVSEITEHYIEFVSIDRAMLAEMGYKDTLRRRVRGRLKYFNTIQEVEQITDKNNKNQIILKFRKAC